MERACGPRLGVGLVDGRGVTDHWVIHTVTAFISHCCGALCMLHRIKPLDVLCMKELNEKVRLSFIVSTLPLA